MLCRSSNFAGSVGFRDTRAIPYAGAQWVEQQCPPMATSCNCISSTLILQQSFSYYCSPQTGFLGLWTGCLPQSLLPSLVFPLSCRLLSIWKRGALRHFNSTQNEVQAFLEGSYGSHCFPRLNLVLCEDIFNFWFLFSDAYTLESSRESVSYAKATSWSRCRYTNQAAFC